MGVGPLLHHAGMLLNNHDSIDQFSCCSHNQCLWIASKDTKNGMTQSNQLFYVYKRFWDIIFTALLIKFHVTIRTHSVYLKRCYKLVYLYGFPRQIMLQSLSIRPKDAKESSGFIYQILYRNRGRLCITRDFFINILI